MQTVIVDDGAEIAYCLEGQAELPVVVLASALGTTHGLFSGQMDALLETHRVLRFDMRGHGASSVPPGPYTIERLGRDVLFLLDTLELAEVGFCGISIGGMVGLWLGIHAPERLRALILANTMAKTADPTPWEQRIARVREAGMEPLLDGVMANWFTPDFSARQPAEVVRIRTMLAGTDKEGYAATCAAVRDLDLEARVPEVGTKTLVIVGRHDPSTPPEQGRAIAAAIPGAYLVELDAAHLSNIEQREGFDVALNAFLQG